MRSTQSTRIARLLSVPVVLALIILAASGGIGSVTAEHQTWPVAGMICTINPTATFTLIAQEGAANMPDGNVIAMWSFAEGGAPFQYPGPVLCVNEGDTVTIVLNNTLSRDVSLIFPGQENVLANGIPSQPQYDGGGVLTSLAPVAAANGGSMTYSFVAGQPGTFLYESGTEPAIQVNMGLFGALVVRPAAHPDWVYNEVVVSGTVTFTTQFSPGTEFILLLSEIDPLLHMAIHDGQPFDMKNYRARYWLMNGRGFPDTIAPNGAQWLPNQPYSSLIYVHPFNDSVAPGDPAFNPYPAAIRMLSVGSENYPHHPHGNHARVIGRDGNVLISSNQEDLSYEKFTVVVGPGQTVDELFAWSDVEGWNPETNPIPVTIPQLQNLTFGPFYSGSPYLGNLDTLPVGLQGLNQCGEYYHISHNHALQQITGWGVVLSGHITFTRIDPPLPNECP